MQKVKTKTALVIILMIAMVAFTIFSIGVLQNNSNQNSQKDGLATYTGYLVGGGQFWYPIRSNDNPQSVTNNLYSFVFSDGRMFIANKTLAESNNITFKATYTVYYNLTEPDIAIDIVKTP